MENKLSLDFCLHFDPVRRAFYPEVLTVRRNQPRVKNEPIGLRCVHVHREYTTQVGALLPGRRTISQA